MAVMSVAEGWPAVFALALVFLARGIFRHAMNLIYVRRARVFEELLGAKLHCRFFGLYSRVRLDGSYQTRKISLTSQARWWGRMTWLTLKSRDLPEQKGFLLEYPHITQNVRQERGTLVHMLHGSPLGCPAEFDRAKIVSALDELIQAETLAKENREVRS